jgi:DNA-binding NarL/FixJ family response regulator
MKSRTVAPLPHDLGDLPHPPVRLVLADDSPQARTAIEAIIDRAPGFELVGSAASGEAAIELIGWLRPDLALLDVRLPGVGGIEAAQAITTSWPGTVVVLVSALDADELPTAVQTCGAKAFMRKSSLTVRKLTALWSRCSESVVLREPVVGDPDTAGPAPREHRQGPEHADAKRPLGGGRSSGE